MERLHREAELRARRAAAAAASGAAEAASSAARVGEEAHSSPSSRRSGRSAGAAAEGNCDKKEDEEEFEEEEEDGTCEADFEGDGEEGEGEPGLDEEDDEEWEDAFVCPLTVRFTQEKIHPFFFRRGPIVNVVPKIRPVVRTLGEEETVELVPPFSPIHCLRKGDEVWSLDNRRLYALQLAAMEQWPQRCRIRVLCRDRLPRRKFKTQYRKFSTNSEGRTVQVCTRFQQFDSWSWFDRAVELEWFELSHMLGRVLSVFEIAPVVLALLFRTGLTGFESRVPLVVAFVLAFAVDFTRQKVTTFERRVCELHVAAVMEGDSRQLHLLGGRSKDQASTGGVSSVQLTAIIAVSLLMVSPYILGMPTGKLRSSLFSCWLGVACVLVFQLAALLRGAVAAGTEYTGAERRLTPKHRDRERDG